jgi:putative ABC transport system substrate-binding protein
MISRRSIVRALAAAVLAAPFRAAAQPAQKPKRIGYLSIDPQPDRQHEMFMRNLRDLGWIEGKNIVIDYRWGAGNVDRVSAMAAELAARNVDLIIVWSTVAALAAKKATSSIPIVMVRVADPVGSGIVASLARPGANITGVSNISPELTGKRLEMLKEIVPGLARVAFLAHGGDPAHKLFLKEAQDAGRKLGIHVQALVVNGIEDIENAFVAMTRDQAGALIVQPIFVSALGQGPRIAQLAIRHRLPATAGGSELVEAGGLIHYGIARGTQLQRGAALVDRVLRGAKPADLPIEQPTRFELIVNMKAARALGLKIPQTLLVRADRVIE